MSIFPSRSRACNARSAAKPTSRTDARAFWKWLKAELALFKRLRQVQDGRHPDRTSIPLEAMLAAVLAMFWFQLPSLHALDDQLQAGGWLRRIIARLGHDDAISDDALRNALTKLDEPSLRAVLHHVNRRVLKGWGAGRYLDSQLGRRLAAIGHQRLASRLVVAIDGHHLFGTTSAKRCCAGCLERTLTIRGKQVPEYYHHVVVAQVIGAHPALILDFEPVLPGENEKVAAKRLLPRLAAIYGERIGVVVADAFFDNEPFRRAVATCGWRSVVVHKTTNHSHSLEAEERLDRRDKERTKPDARYRQGPGAEYRVWEEAAGGRRLIEVRRITKAGTWKSQGVTDLPADQAHPVAVGILVEERWDIENTGFKQLATDWKLDRAYVHTNRPTAVAACVTLALLAYNAFHTFVYRKLKLDPTTPERALQAFRRDLIFTADSLGRRETAHARPP